MHRGFGLAGPYISREVWGFLKVVVVHVQGSRRQGLQEPGMAQDVLQPDALVWVGHQEAGQQVFAGIACGDLGGQQVDGVLKLLGVLLVFDVKGVPTVDLQENNSGDVVCGWSYFFPLNFLRLPHTSGSHSLAHRGNRSTACKIVFKESTRRERISMSRKGTADSR